MNRTLFFLAVTTLIAACSSKPADPVVPTPPAARQSTVIDPQLKALDDAKKVEATLLEADRKNRKAIEDAGG